MWKRSYPNLPDLCLRIRHNYLQCQTPSFPSCEAQAVSFVQNILFYGGFSQKRQKMRCESPSELWCLLFHGQEHPGWIHPWLPSTSVPLSTQLSGDFAHIRVPWAAHQSHLGAACLLWAPLRAPEKAQEGVAWIRWYFSPFYKIFVCKKCFIATK